MAIPSRVVALNGAMATVECFGEKREVSLMLIDEQVSLGDYLLVQAGGFAYERLDFEAARETLQIFSTLIGKVSLT
jgi:hydrogenase expression/formation protein HypC